MNPSHTDPAKALPQALMLFAWLNAVAITILLVSELVILSLSLDWAVAGIFHFGVRIAYGLLAALFAVSAFAAWHFFRRALRSERELVAAQPSAPGAADD